MEVPWTSTKAYEQQSGKTPSIKKRQHLNHSFLSIYLYTYIEKFSCDIHGYKFFWPNLLGVLLLDFDARDYHSVVNRLVEEFGINDDLSEEVKAEVLRTLLLPHKYVDGHTSNFKLGDMKRSFSKTSFKSFKGVRKNFFSVLPIFTLYYIV